MHVNNLLTNAEAAKVLNITPGTLSVWRSTGRHEIPYIKIGRKVRYRLDDLEAFLRLQTYKKTTAKNLEKL